MRVLLIFLFCGSMLTVNAQSLDYAVQQAVINNDYSSSISFSGAYKLTTGKVNSWLESHTVSYPGSDNTKIITGLYKAEYGSAFVYGAERTYLTKLIFVRADQYNQFTAYWQKQEELAKERQERDKVTATLVAVGAGYLLWQGGKKVLQAIGNTLSSAGSGNTNYPAGSSPAPAEKKDEPCDPGKVPSFKEYDDGIKNNWIQKYQQYSIRFDNGKSGKIVYWLDDKHWSMYAPAGFSFRGDYQHYMSKEYAIAALYEWEMCGTISKTGKK